MQDLQKVPASAWVPSKKQGQHREGFISSETFLVWDSKRYFPQKRDPGRTGVEMGVGDGLSGQLNKYYQRGDSHFLLRAVLKILVSVGICFEDLLPASRDR